MLVQYTADNCPNIHILTSALLIVFLEESGFKLAYQSWPDCDSVNYGSLLNWKLRPGTIMGASTPCDYATVVYCENHVVSKTKSTFGQLVGLDTFKTTLLKKYLSFYS